jgi:hypothetical protein
VVVKFRFQGKGYGSAFKMKVKITMRTIVSEATWYIFIAEITLHTMWAFFEENKRMLGVQWVLQFEGLCAT